MVFEATNGSDRWLIDIGRLTFIWWKPRAWGLRKLRHNWGFWRSSACAHLELGHVDLIWRCSRRRSR